MAKKSGASFLEQLNHALGGQGAIGATAFETKLGQRRSLGVG
jgi:hypothetical protein